MQIRRATTQDAPAIARMWHLQWHQAHAGIVSSDLVRSRSPAEFAARVAAHLPDCFVADAGDAVVGFFMISGDELYQFYVAPQVQGQGVAALLMDAAEARLPAGNVWLACSVGNDRAARFYEKRGWQRTGTQTVDVEATDGPLPVEVWRYEKQL